MAEATMSHRVMAVCLVVLAFSAVCAADDSPARRSPGGERRAEKPPWEWTVEERLADRFDAVKIRKRRLAYEAAYPRAAATGNGVQAQSIETAQRLPVVHGIDGSRNPELFLPYELFDGLMTGLDARQSVRSKQRAYYNPGLQKLGYDPEMFWSALESVSANYRTLLFGTSESSRPQDISARADARCRERYDALEAARALFGRRQFDMLLYTAVAPYSGYSGATFDIDPTAAYRRADGGCR